MKMMSPSLLSRFPRFQGISIIKHSDTANDFVGKVSHTDDQKLLKALEVILETEKPSSVNSGSTMDVVYLRSGDQFLSVRKMDNGVEVYMTTPEIRIAGGGLGDDGRLGRYSHPYLYLTFDTVSPLLHGDLKRVHQKVCDKLKTSHVRDNTKQQMALSRAIESLIPSK